MISSQRRPSVSIVMPVLNEAEAIAGRLEALAPLRAAGAELIVVDGGSADESAARAAPLADRLVVSARGRARQMNAGARAARGDILLFLHADTALPDGALVYVAEGVRKGAAWGRFDVEIVGRSALLPLVALTMNIRSRLTGIATGDQAIFVRRDVFERTGGFPEIALMEDVALSKRLKSVGPPFCVSGRARTSGRRWDRNGALRTVVLMWRLRLSYFLGADPNVLARRYGYAPDED